MVRNRSPQVQDRHLNEVQAWLVGGGVASLSAAVFLVKEAKVSPSHIHVLEVHSGPGGALADGGEPSTGYSLHSGRDLTLHDTSVEDLLSHVPSDIYPDKTVLEDIKAFNNSAEHGRAQTRLLVEGKSGPEKLDARNFGISLKDRLELLKLMMQSERSLENRKVSDFFSAEFWNTTFWTVWSTTFAFHPWHSAIEFRRYLRTYLHDIHNLDNSKRIIRTRYSQYDSIIVPITKFLRSQGVDFMLNERVVDIITEEKKLKVSKIKVALDNGEDRMIRVDPSDLVMITLGSVGSGTVLGTNTTAPDPIAVNSEESVNSDWSLWLQLAKKSHKFGVPSNFCSRVSESRLMTFTVTLGSTEFFDRLFELTHNRPGDQPVLSLKDSNWALSLNMAHQPLFRDQPANTYVFFGYSLQPWREGKFVKKPMLECSGREIMTEILQLLRFPLEPILSSSTTVPCVMPELTAPLLSRTCEDRPKVIPEDTSNLALLGQFVDIPDEATGSLEYSVRGAEIAVHHLMGLPKNIRKSRRNYVVEFLDVLA